MSNHDSSGVYFASHSDQAASGGHVANAVFSTTVVQPVVGVEKLPSSTLMLFNNNDLLPVILFV